MNSLFRQGIYLLSLLLALAILGGLLSLFSLSWQEVGQALRHAGWGSLLAVVAVYGIQLLAQTFSWQALLEGAAKPCRWTSLWQATCTGWAGNFLTPSMYLGGEPFRAYVLSRWENISFSEALASVVAHKFLELFSFLFFLLLAFWGVVFYFSHLVGARWIWGSGLLLSTVFGGLFYLKVKLLRGDWPLSEVLPRLLGNWARGGAESLQKYLERSLQWSQPVGRRALGGMVLFHLAVFLRPLGYFWICLSPPTFGELALLFLAIQFAQAFQFTPGGVGIVEGGALGTFSLLGLSPSHALAYMIFCRVGEILFVLLGLGGLFTFWTQKSKESEE